MSDPKQCNDAENTPIGTTPQPMAVPMAVLSPAQKPMSMNRPDSTKNDGNGSKA